MELKTYMDIKKLKIKILEELILLNEQVSKWRSGYRVWLKTRKSYGSIPTFGIQIIFL